MSINEQCEWKKIKRNRYILIDNDKTYNKPLKERKYFKLPIDMIGLLNFEYIVKLGKYLENNELSEQLDVNGNIFYTKSHLGIYGCKLSKLLLNNLNTLSFNKLTNYINSIQIRLFPPYYKYSENYGPYIDIVSIVEKKTTMLIKVINGEFI